MIGASVLKGRRVGEEGGAEGSGGGGGGCWHVQYTVLGSKHRSLTQLEEPINR